jgi:TolB-like protein
MRLRIRLGLLVLSLTAYPLLGETVQNGNHASGPESPRHTIAVLPFRNSSDKADLDPICQGIADLMPACARKAEGVAFVERQRLDKIIAEQKVSLVGLSDPNMSVRLGKLLGAKYVVLGGVLSRQNMVVINAHLYEVETARVVRSAESTGKISDLLDLIQSLSTELMQALRVELPALSSADIDRSPEANLHFMRGLGYYYGNMPHHAIAEFMRTLGIDPKHSRCRYWNAKVYFDLREYRHAKIELTRFLSEFPEHEYALKAKRMLSTSELEEGK